MCFCLLEGTERFMRVLRGFTIFLFFMFILTLSMFLPSLLSDIKDQILFGKIYIEELSEKVPTDTIELSTSDKLALISSSRGLTNRYVSSTQQSLSLNSALKENDIFEKGINEMKKLQKDNVIPEIDLTVIEKGSLIKKAKTVDLSVIEKNSISITNYISLDKPDNNVQVWNLSYSTENYIITIMMDSNTNKIYEFSIWSMNYNTTKFSFEFNEIPDKFAEYLGLEWDSVESMDYDIAKYTAYDNKISYQYIYSNNGLSFWISSL